MRCRLGGLTLLARLLTLPVDGYGQLVGNRIAILCGQQGKQLAIGRFGGGVVGQSEVRVGLHRGRRDAQILTQVRAGQGTCGLVGGVTPALLRGQVLGRLDHHGGPVRMFGEVLSQFETAFDDARQSRLALRLSGVVGLVLQDQHCGIGRIGGALEARVGVGGTQEMFGCGLRLVDGLEGFRHQQLDVGGVGGIREHLQQTQVPVGGIAVMCMALGAGCLSQRMVVLGDQTGIAVHPGKHRRVGGLGRPVSGVRCIADGVLAHAAQGFGGVSGIAENADLALVEVWRQRVLRVATGKTFEGVCGGIEHVFFQIQGPQAGVDQGVVVGLVGSRSVMPGECIGAAEFDQRQAGHAQGIAYPWVVCGE